MTNMYSENKTYHGITAAQHYALQIQEQLQNKSQNNSEANPGVIPNKSK